MAEVRQRGRERRNQLHLLQLIRCPWRHCHGRVKSFHNVSPSCAAGPNREAAGSTSATRKQNLVHVVTATEIPDNDGVADGSRLLSQPLETRRFLEEATTQLEC